MAPGRGRRGGRGETRMDAALDALVPMGFPKAAIRKKVNELLKVYGGPDGWVFVEEASYKLVIEQLLGGEEGSDPGPPLSMSTCEAADQDNMHGDAGSSSAAGPSNAADIPAHDMILPSLDAEKTGADGGCNQDSAMTDEVSFVQQDSTNNTENVIPSQMEHSLIPPSPLEMKHTPPPLPPETEYVPPPPPPPPPEMKSTPPAGPAMPRTSNLPSRKHRPCYGWWGDETDDVMFLPLMPVPPKRAS